jgi:hypothetical protein
MDIDIAALLGAIVEENGGSFEIKAETFQKVISDPTEKFLVIDYDEQREVLVLGVANAEDVALEDEDGS